MSPERWQEVERLYHATLERDTGERPAFLTGACHGDEELRREVESLLKYQDQAKDFIDTPAGGKVRPPITAALRRAEMSVPGRYVGHVFGVYELKSWIAAGGMGEVYRAVDTRLNRTVAIKILREHWSNDEDRRQRFRREAKVISSLNHPHICTLYDIGVQDGIDYLVMEYIDGETLYKRLARGPLSIARALEYAMQIADALDKAHRRGIIHRDLKPGNVMLTSSGVKVLDFGLATRLPEAGPGREPAENSDIVTRERIVMGTPGYSSPEQLQGNKVDVRTDLFSFGATAYEMIAGHRAFAPGKDEPKPLRDVVADVPVSLERTLNRCLAKDPDDRWQTANDLLFELRSIASTDASAKIAKPERRRIPAGIERVLWAIAILMLTAGAFIFATRNATIHLDAISREIPDVRFSVYAPPGADFHAVQDVPFALSPDGRRLVFVAVKTDGIKQLWLRPLASDVDQAEPMPGTEGANSPFWSPDSQWVGFFAENSLKKIRVSTGLVQLIAGNVSTMAGATWNAGDIILFPEGPGGLVRVSAQGGPVLRATSGKGDHFWPKFLRDGKHFLYSAPETAEIRIGSLEEETSRALMKFPVRISSLGYAPGYVFFSQDGTLFARPLDEQRLKFSGERIALLEGVPVTPPGRAPFSVSAAGLLAWWAYSSGAPAVLQWFERDGRTTTVVDKPAKYVGFTLSPDGRRLAFSRRAPNGGADLWIRDLTRGSEMQLTYNGASNGPQWSPDGAHIAFSDPGGDPPPKLFVKSLATGGADRQFGSLSAPSFASGWSRDGKLIISVRMDAVNRDDLWMEQIREGKGERMTMNTPASESYGRLSPDDQLLAYVTDESGKDEVWIASFPSGAIRRQVSFGGGTSPDWSPDGHEIFYVSQDKRLMVSTVKPLQSGLDVGPPRPLFAIKNLAEVDQLLFPTCNSYTVAPDGRRFLVAVRARDPDAPPIRILVSWRALLHARAASGIARREER